MTTPPPPPSFRPGERVNRRENRPQVAAVVVAVIDPADPADPMGAGPVLLLRYDEGGEGWWPASAVEPLANPVGAGDAGAAPAPPAPDPEP